jgi:hypothetical protein
MKKQNNKKGSSVLIAPIILTISLVMLILIGTYTINFIQPFIWYEKLNNVGLKYMFIIEKYGYLTFEEENNLIMELENKGFKKENITLDVPKEIKKYGELIELNLNYKMIVKIPVVSNIIGGTIDKNININVCKSSYSKR